MKRLICIFCLLAVSAVAVAQLSVTNLRTAGLVSPSGIDPSAPLKVSWILETSKQNTVQEAYELTLKSGSSTVWKSGKVISDNSILVPVGAALKPCTAYTWTVKAWDNNGQVSKPVSASFSTGVAEDGWMAQWIGISWDDPKSTHSPVYFRKSVAPRKAVRRAVAYVTSHGIYEFTLNGRKVGQDYLTPGWTSYHNTLQYQAYDVTASLQKGHNEIGALVSPGWYASGLGWGNPAKRLRYGTDLALFFQLDIEYTDGKHELVCSDGSWEMSLTGPVQAATIYDGETVDPSVPFSWQPAGVLPGVFSEKLVASVSEPVRERTKVRPVKCFVTPKGETVIDFGQNLVGWETLRIKGQKGQVVTVKHGEVLDKEGNFFDATLRQAKALSTYVLTGGDDFFEPRHTFYGFRYIKVEGLESFDPDAFEAVAVDSGFETIGSFNTSNELINKLQSNIFWGFRGNFVDIPTDCPQRDERLGWTGDAEVFFRTATFNGKVDNFFRKWLRTLSEDQYEDGGVPAVVPDIFFGTHGGFAAGWADCATIIPWQHYMAYGDLEVLRSQYPSMKAWVDYQLAHCNNYLLNTLRQPYGDWLFWSVDNDTSGKSAVTSKNLIAQSFMAASVETVANTAALLGLADDARFYAGELAKVKDAYLKEYVTPNGLVSSDTQTAYVLALYFNLLPQELCQQAADRLAENVKQYNYHITTGFLGTPRICQVLTEYGYTDVAYRLLLQDTCPSWIYPVKMGATTIWERWNSIQPDGSIMNGGMNSFNHYSYGAIGDWLYRYAVGIRETEPGYKSFVVDPHPGGGFKFMEASTMTPYGKISVKWEADGDVIRSLNVSIPVGTTADVFCPDGEVRTLGSGNYGFGVELED